MPYGAVTAFPQTSENQGKGQDLSGLQAGICLVQHNLTTCDWSSQPEVSATDEPLAGSGAGTALSPTEQVDFTVYVGPRCSIPCFSTVPCLQ